MVWPPVTCGDSFESIDRRDLRAWWMALARLTWDDAFESIDRECPLASRGSALTWGDSVRCRW